MRLKIKKWKINENSAFKEKTGIIEFMINVEKTKKGRRKLKAY